MLYDEIDRKIDGAVDFWSSKHRDLWLEWGYLSQGDLDLPEEELRDRLDLPGVKLTVALVRKGIACSNSEATKILLRSTKHAVKYYIMSEKHK